MKSSFSRRRKSPHFALPLLVLFSSVFPAFASDAAGDITISKEVRAKNLFIVVANGIRYNDAFGNKNHLYTENIWTKLRLQGTICANFYNNELTYPIPAQASLLTGVWHVFENPLNDRIRPALPTLFEYWNKKRKAPDVSSYFAAGRMQYEILTSSEYAGFGSIYAPIFETIIKNCGDAGKSKDSSGITYSALYSKALSYIFERHPSFVYLNLDPGESGSNAHSHDLECRVNGCGDETAGHINAYYESIIIVDSIVYDLWSRIQRDEVYKDNSVFIFMSAHGRHTGDFRGFGDNCRGCRHLNFLIAGPGVKKNYISQKKRTLIDICPTVGALCDIPTPHAKGKIMKEIME